MREDMQWISGVLSILFILLVFALVLVAAYYATRLVAKGYTPTIMGGNMRVLERISLGQDRQLLIVSVGERRLLLGSSQKGVELICDITDQPLSYPDTPAPTDFSGILKSTIKNRLFVKKGENNDQRGEL